MKPKALILKAPGTNCDQEAYWALGQAGADPEVVYLSQLEGNPKKLFDYNLLFIPGGFSYGDYLGSGKVFSLFIETSLGDAMRRFAAEGRTVIGVCNGFQVLVKMGLLPGSEERGARREEKQTVSLTFNKTGRFECRWVPLEFQKRSILSKRLSLHSSPLTPHPELPIAHGEGRFVTASPKILSRLEKDGLVFLRYYKENHNGSVNRIAGITNREGNVIGLMPHPERFAKREHHYNWPANEEFFPWGLEFLKAVIRVRC
ncbi:MAG: phosphoribosylformylglycinamidine synthase I [Elusimicrobia bacterium]|nr:phosphoribosylformylglycinamidine synthase I [Elusimicrobiota bacterium]